MNRPSLLSLLAAAALLCFVSIGTAPVVRADDARYVTETHGNMVWTFPETERERVESLIEDAPAQWEEIAADVGVPVDDTLNIIIARNPAEMAKFTPARPPEYAAGVAFPQASVIAVTLIDPGSAHPHDVETTLVHELSHIAFHRATAGNPTPRWFREGLAIYHSEAHGIPRMRTMLRAAVGHSTLPLKELSDRFPGGPFQVSIAYAQSADVVATMRRYDDDGRRFKSLISELRRGVEFESALATSFGWNLLGLEQYWRDSMRTRYRIVPLVFGGTTLWSLASLLLIAAWRRRRREHRDKLAQLERQEALEEEPGNVDAFVAIFPEGMDERSASVMRADSTVPVVEHDGESHTLH